MKRLKPANSSTTSPLRQPPQPDSAGLAELQRQVAQAIMRPLTPADRMQTAGQSAAALVKPNDRLSSFERLEIYNRQYWFRLLDCLYEDYPGLRAVLGDSRFLRVVTAYLEKYPSTSPSLRDLGSRLVRFIEEEPERVAPHQQVALEMAKVEWAQVVAFDGEARPATTLARASPEDIHLRLQPYITLLELTFPVDQVLVRILRQGGRLRSEASNAVEAFTRGRRHSIASRIRPAPAWLLVHRHENLVYFKRLTRSQFALLHAMERGANLVAACAAAEAISPPPTPQEIQSWFQNWSELGFLVPVRARKR